MIKNWMREDIRQQLKEIEVEILDKRIRVKEKIFYDLQREVDERYAELLRLYQERNELTGKIVDWGKI